MQYNPMTDKLEISTKDAQRATRRLLYALRQIRLTAGHPLDRHERPGAMEPADHACAAVMDTATILGINLGAEWANDIDLRNIG